MLKTIVRWWQFHFWLGTACLVAGIAVVSPFLPSKAFGKWFGRSDIDLETLGLVVLVVAVVIIGLYNYLGRSSGV
jgi:uncharacterized membrane protein (DUF4010 family)